MTPSIRTPRRWRRTVAIAAIGALVGLSMLAGPAANAEPVPGDTVTFTGGCGLLGLGARSHPAAAEVSVSAGDEVRFVNRLGQPATMWLDGQAAAEVPAGGVASITFHDGPVTVTMQISCLLGKPAAAVEVEVLVTRPAKEGGSPGSGPPGSGSGPGSDGTGTTSPSLPGSSPASGKSTSPAGDGTQAGPPAGPATAGATESPGSGPDPAGVGHPATSTPAGPGAEAAAAELPDPTGVPADGSRSAPSGADDLSAGWGIGIGLGAKEPAGAEPSGSTPRSPAAGTAPGSGGAIGLLALIATVCLVGVAAGAIRTLATQRANQLEAI